MIGSGTDGCGRKDILEAKNRTWAGRQMFNAACCPIDKIPAPTPPAPTPLEPRPQPPTPAPTVPELAPTPAPSPAACATGQICQCYYSYHARMTNTNFEWNLCSSDVETGPGGNLPIRYKEVAPSTDLIVEALTPYEAKDYSKNGRSGCLGQLNLKSPGHVKVRFALVKAGTKDLMPAGQTFEMTIYDFDKSNKGMLERVGVSGFSNIEAVEMKPDIRDGVSWFTASDSEIENPTDPNDLTQEQLEASFSVSYSGTSEWIVEFEAREETPSGKKGGRNFLFSGASCVSADRHKCYCPTQEEIDSGVHRTFR